MKPDLVPHASPTVEEERGEQQPAPPEFKLGFTPWTYAQRCLPDRQQQAERLERLRVKWHGEPQPIIQRIGDIHRRGGWVFWLLLAAYAMRALARAW